jgi:Flp pilus assembly pilin Flp
MLMKGLQSRLRRLLVANDGVTAVHFAVMMALIAIVWLTAVASISNGTTATF